MQFHKDTAQVYIPDGIHPEEAYPRTTHLAIGAHQDDLEIMAIDGILACYQRKDRWFAGVVVTNGAGSAREGLYKDYTDEDMRAVRIREQRKAAYIGEYSAQFFLDYTSAEVKDASNKNTVEDIADILRATKPEIIYTHNLADKHPTHVAVALRVIQALRSLSAEYQPERVIGCEVWRELSWMMDEDKVVLDCSIQENLQMALVGVYDSQITGGKRYDLATMGRRRANATYFASHDVDISTGMTFGMDLIPLIKDPSLDIWEYAHSFIARFQEDVRKMINGLQ
jgi:LmbE family N-acetylglucosaminyl deacetylase